MECQKYIKTQDQYLWPALSKHFDVNSWIFEEVNVPAHEAGKLKYGKKYNSCIVLACTIQDMCLKWKISENLKIIWAKNI